MQRGIPFEDYITTFIGRYRFGSTEMKEIDDTPVPETESEVPIEVRVGLLEALVASLELEMARLVHDLQRPTVENDDPEWFS